MNLDKKKLLIKYFIILATSLGLTLVCVYEFYSHEVWRHFVRATSDLNVKQFEICLIWKIAFLLLWKHAFLKVTLNFESWLKTSQSGRGLYQVYCGNCHRMFAIATCLFKRTRIATGKHTAYENSTSIRKYLWPLQNIQSIFYRKMKRETPHSHQESTYEVSNWNICSEILWLTFYGRPENFQHENIIQGTFIKII